MRARRRPTRSARRASSNAANTPSSSACTATASSYFPAVSSACAFFVRCFRCFTSSFTSATTCLPYSVEIWGRCSFCDRSRIDFVLLVTVRPSGDRLPHIRHPIPRRLPLLRRHIRHRVCPRHNLRRVLIHRLLLTLNHERVEHDGARRAVVVQGQAELVAQV